MPKNGRDFRGGNVAVGTPPMGMLLGVHPPGILSICSCWRTLDDMFPPTRRCRHAVRASKRRTLAFGMAPRVGEVFAGDALVHLDDVLPEALGHELAAELGVVARLDGYGVVEALPRGLHELLVGGLVGQVHLVGAHEVPIAALVDAGHAMVLVEDDERLGVEAAAEPVHEQGHHRSARVAAREPHAVLQMLEAQELQHAVALVSDGAHEAHERLHRWMGEVVEDAAARLARAAGRAGGPPGAQGAAARSALAAARAVVRAVRRHRIADEAVDDDAGARVVGERCAQRGVVAGMPARAPDAAPHAQSQLLVRLDGAHGLPEARLERVLHGHVLRVLAVGVGHEHGGEQPFWRAVVDVGHVFERLLGPGRGGWGGRRHGLGRGGRIGLEAHAHTASGCSRARCQP